MRIALDSRFYRRYADRISNTRRLSTIEYQPIRTFSMARLQPGSRHWVAAIGALIDLFWQCRKRLEQH